MFVDSKFYKLNKYLDFLYARKAALITIIITIKDAPRVTYNKTIVVTRSSPLPLQ